MRQTGNLQELRERIVEENDSESYKSSNSSSPFRMDESESV